MNQSVQKLATSLAGEYALALLWPLSTVVYAFLPPVAATILGIAAVWPLCVYAIVVACPAKKPPRVSPALIMLDLFHLPAPGSRRGRSVKGTLYRTEPILVGLVRLALHWLGGFSGFYLLNVCFGQGVRHATEEGLSVIWALIGRFAGPDPVTRQASSNVLYLLAFHVGLQGLIGGLQMQFLSARKGREKSFGGAMLSLLGYPWAAPHFSVGSFLWIAHGAGLSSLTLMTVSVLACPLSALVAAFFYATVTPVQIAKNTDIDELD